MAYIVPKFIEREPKIIGPLTFKQFIFFLAATVIGFFLYYSIGKKNFLLFVLLILPITGFAFALAFGNVAGRPFPVFFKNLLTFLSGPKLFSFKRKIFGPEIFHSKIKRVKEEKEMPSLKPSDKSSLQKIFTEIITKK